jgi:hypothetical protein
MIPISATLCIKIITHNLYFSPYIIRRDHIEENKMGGTCSMYVLFPDISKLINSMKNSLSQESDSR